MQWGKDTENLFTRWPAHCTAITGIDAKYSNALLRFLNIISDKIQFHVNALTYQTHKDQYVNYNYTILKQECTKTKCIITPKTCVVLLKFIFFIPSGDFGLE